MANWNRITDRIRDALESEPISSLDLGPAVTVLPEATLQEVVETLQQRHIGCVLVAGEQGLEGIFTERDLLTRVAATGCELRRPSVRAGGAWLPQGTASKPVNNGGKAIWSERCPERLGDRRAGT